MWQKVVKSVSYASETWCVGLLYAKKGITMKHCRVGVVQSAQRAAAVSSGRHADGQCSRNVTLLFSGAAAAKNIFLPI